MENKKILLVCTCVAFALGGVIGFWLRPGATVPAAVSAETTPRPIKPKTPNESSETQRLRARIRELERKLAQQKETTPTVVAETPPADKPAMAQPPDDDRPPRPPTVAEMRARMEALRTRDPQRYAQMTNRHARMRARRLLRTQNQLDILGSVDRTRLTAAERDVHDRYQEAVARREELREMLAPENTDMTEEQRHELFREMRDLDRTTRELANAERQTLLTRTAQDLGIAESDAKDFVETMSAIYEATQSHGGPGGGPPPPPPPDGGAPR